MSEPHPSSGFCGSDHCVTCADEAVPMSVLSLEAQQGLALCLDAGGARHTVEIALVEQVGPGQRLLVHAGVALATLPADGEAGADRNHPARRREVA